jgi:hypothetical protein
MLQIAIHHDDPGGAGNAEAFDDGATEAAPPLIRLSMHQQDVPCRSASSHFDGLIRPVVAVIHEDDFHVPIREYVVEATDQLMHIAGFVTGGNDDRDDRRGNGPKYSGDCWIPDGVGSYELVDHRRLLLGCHAGG